MRVDELLDKKHISYRIQGQDFVVCCLNPDHDDKNPSMRIDKLTGIFSCFSCGFKGNLFSYFAEKANWLQIRRDLLKNKISEKLAENIGLQIPKNAVYFNRDWRGIDGTTFEQFQAFEHSNAEFLGRIVFPIYSISGKIIAFNGRHLDKTHKTKYLISPAKAKLPLFPSTAKPLNGKIILVEGILDMINLHDKGLTNVMCCFGTRKVTKDKLNLLKVKGVDGVDIFFDGDEAGQEAAVQVKELAESVELTTRNIYMSNIDPGELTASKVLKLKETLYG